MSDTRNIRLSAEGISKHYGAVQALSDVHFSIREGEIVALLGENGAGKSTLVKVLSGLVVPDSGTITIDGGTVDLSTSAKSQEAGIAVVQQEYSTVPALSVAENLVLGRNDAPILWAGKSMRANARSLLAEVGLEHIDPRTKVADLTVAEMQLLEIARVLARDAKIVIFDEPTAALSAVDAQRVLEVVRNLAAKNISVIYVTHRLPEVYEIADTVAIFRNGRSLPSVSTADVDVNAVIAMMIGRELDTMFPDRAVELGDTRLELSGVKIAGMERAVTLSARRGEILGLTGQLGSGADLVGKALASEAAILSGTVKIGRAHV